MSSSTNTYVALAIHVYSILLKENYSYLILQETSHHAPQEHIRKQVLPLTVQVCKYTTYRFHSVALNQTEYIDDLASKTYKHM